MAPPPLSRGPGLLRLVKPSASRGRIRGRPLRLTDLHLGLAGFPQLSGLRLDAHEPSPRRQVHSVSGRGHSDASAVLTEEEKLPGTAQHQLRETDSEGQTVTTPAVKTPEESLNFHFPLREPQRTRGVHLPCGTSEKRKKKNQGGFTSRGRRTETGFERDRRLPPYIGLLQVM
ncbi:unnamed protein product [Pleuronectes platessa]|uniref:Uncharacterized protein n=1 Tax=Pleuronectes platessa TaxID=8262 RepID=A0A9N7U1G2_PLEPL|nr:unnamed protein product [Pleuronectes platessa]